jgi:hypothetical protein
MRSRYYFLECYVALTSLLIKIKALWDMTRITLKMEAASSSETSVTNYQSKPLIYQKISIFIVLHAAETVDLKTSKSNPQTNSYLHNFLFPFDIILSYLILTTISSYFHNFLLPFDPILSYLILSSLISVPIFTFSQLPLSLRSYPILSYPILSYPHSYQFPSLHFHNTLFPFDPILASHNLIYLQNQVSLRSDLLTSPNFKVPTCNWRYYR